MASYPLLTTIKELRVTAKYDTVLTSLLDGTVLRFSRRAEPLYQLEIVHPQLTTANWASLDDFYRSMKGAYGRWTLIDPISRKWEEQTVGGSEHGIYIATGDGATLAYDVPAKSFTPGTCNVYTEHPTTGVVTTVNPANYTLAAIGGTDGRGTLNFNAGSSPTSGHRIGFDTDDGYRCWYCVFGDSLSARRTFVGRDIVDSITVYEAKS